MRPISADDVLDADASQPCRWLAEFGKLYLRPKDFFISDRGKVVTWKREFPSKNFLPHFRFASIRNSEFRIPQTMVRKTRQFARTACG